MKFGEFSFIVHDWGCKVNGSGDLTRNSVSGKETSGGADGGDVRCNARGNVRRTWWGLDHDRGERDERRERGAGRGCRDAPAGRLYGWDWQRIRDPEHALSEAEGSRVFRG